MKYAIALSITIFSLLLCLTACGADAPDGEKQAQAESRSLTIEDIEWNVDEGIVDGERFVLLDYTNHSECTIVGFELQFTQRDDISEEEREAFFADLQERFAVDESDPDEAEVFAELQEEDISMRAGSEWVAKTGESVSAIPCTYYYGYEYVTDLSHYSLVTPDIASIRYIDGEKVVTVYYDFVSQKYSTDSETENSASL